MKNDIEVEIRGPLSQDEYENFKKDLSQNGRYIKKYTRCILDYTPFTKEKFKSKTDVRIRTTDGHVEIIIKAGTLASTTRKEASMFVENNDLESALKVMNFLGYKKGVVTKKYREIFIVNGIEISLDRIENLNNGKIHSIFFEAEKMCNLSNVSETEVEIEKFLKQKNINTFSKKEWLSYIRNLYHEANGFFEYGVDDYKDFSRIMIIV